MRNCFRWRTAYADFDQLRIAQHPGRQTFDLGRQGCREQKRLPIRRDFFDNPPHIRQKTHVEHAIHFVEHQKFHFLQRHRALLEQIEQSSGSGYKNIDTALEFLALFSVTDAAVHQRDPQIREPAIIAERRFDLRRQFACRLEHETSERAVLCEKRQDRKRERRGFAGACLRRADQILARKNNRERAQLNWRRLDKSHRLSPAHDFRRKSEIIK